LGNVKLGHVARIWKRKAYWLLFADLKETPLGRPTGRAEDINTLWTGDADLRLYIATVQDG